ncbi:MAG: DUF3365 domain-containing protein [Planctomycetaceae bacterium]|nr:DUF3365 domain-containing protein [Planctomycetaceae bacterium]
MRKSLLVVAPMVILLIAAILLPLANSANNLVLANKKAVNRTRKTVRMLDDIYKTAVVLITTHYVKDKDSLPAGSAAKALFAAVKKKGWHEVKILDVSGEPYNDDNVAKDAFDKAAAKLIKSGKPYVDEVIKKDGKSYLRAATIIPVVMEKCIMCHANYKKAKKGEAIGMLSYTIPVE